MRLKKVKNAIERIHVSEYYVNSPESYQGKWKQVFSNEKPIYLEIGMGKGNFIINSAINNPEINFYGLDKFPTVILKAINKLNKLESKPKNLKFLAIDVKDIFEYFPKNFFDKIFLNFSDPWPKKRHEKRRLTSNVYLKLYKDLLAKDGIIQFKTDNDNLYAYSLENIKNKSDIEIIEFTDNLYAKLNPENCILTEYEKKFIGIGIPIKLISFKFR
jgi:tRNA (guanine-N7-)-methyltransferase